MKWPQSHHEKWLEAEIVRLHAELDAKQKKIDSLEMSIMAQLPMGQTYVQRMEPPDETPVDSEPIGGTPWQRILRRSMLEQREEAAAEERKKEESRKAGHAAILAARKPQ